MKFKEYIEEEFYKGFKSGGQYVEVWENPTGREMSEAGGKHKAIRFTADSKTKTVYVWDAMTQVHHYVWEKIGDSRHAYDPSLLNGTARYIKGEWLMTQSDGEKRGLNLKNRKQRYQQFKWVNKYFSIEDFFRDY